MAEIKLKSEVEIAVGFSYTPFHITYGKGVNVSSKFGHSLVK